MVVAILHAEANGAYSWGTKCYKITWYKYRPMLPCPEEPSQFCTCVELMQSYFDMILNDTNTQRKLIWISRIFAITNVC